MRFEKSPLRNDRVDLSSLEFTQLSPDLKSLLYLRNAALSAAISAYECGCANCKKIALAKLLTYQGAVIRVYGTSTPERQFLDDLALHQVDTHTSLFEKNGVSKQHKATAIPGGPDSDKTTA